MNRNVYVVGVRRVGGGEGGGDVRGVGRGRGRGRGRESCC